MRVETDLPNSEGNTPLIACCLRAYNSGSSESAAQLDVTKNDRLACVKLLLDYGCDLNA